MTQTHLRESLLNEAQNNRVGNFRLGLNAKTMQFMSSCGKRAETEKGGSKTSTKLPKGLGRLKAETRALEASFRNDLLHENNK